MATEVQVQTQRMIDLAWAAGFVDGEGCFAAYVKNTGPWPGSVQPVFNINGVEPGPLYELCVIFGHGAVRQERGSTTVKRQVWGLRLSRAEVLVEIITELLPFLRLKHDQAEIVLTLAQDIVDHQERGVWANNERRKFRQDCARALAQAKGRLEVAA